MNIFGLSDVFVNKGYGDDPAVRFSEKSDAFFAIGKSVYDAKAENNRRYINFDVKAFGDLGARIKKMDVKAGSRLNITGRLDQESWDDKDTGKKRTKTVLILETVEFGFVSKEGQNGANGNAGGQNGSPNGGGNGYDGQNGYGNPGVGASPQQGAMPPQYTQMPQQYPQQLGTAPDYQQQPMPQQGQMPQGFTGYENFGQNGNGGNPYFNQG